MNNGLLLVLFGVAFVSIGAVLLGSADNAVTASCFLVGGACFVGGAVLMRRQTTETERL